MKAICDRVALLDAVNIVTSVVAARSPSPALLCVKIVAEDGLLTLAGTDGEIGVRVGVDRVDVREPGSLLIPADKIVQIVRNSVDSTLTLTSAEKAIHIRGTDSYFTVFGHDPADAPKVREFDAAPQCEVELGALRMLIQRTLFAAARENSKYAINGVLFNRKERALQLVATDGRRLAVARGQCLKGTGNSNCIVPTKALALIDRLSLPPETHVRIVIEEHQVLFAVGEGAAGCVISSNLVEGLFPPFEDVIPRDHDKHVTSNVEVLSSAIRRAALLTNEESKGVRLRFEDNRLTLRSRAPEMGEAEIQVDLKYEGEPVEIGFNPGYITDALKVIDAPEVVIELKTNNKPGVLKTGNEFTYVVMPVSL